MYTMSQINHIKDLSNCGYRISEISKKTGADPKTIRKYLSQEDFSPVPPVVQTQPSKLDPFKPVIHEWLDEDKKHWRKQHHTAQRIYERLVEEQGYTGSYSVVQRYLKKCRSVQTEKRTLNWYGIPARPRLILEKLISMKTENWSERNILLYRSLTAMMDTVRYSAVKRLNVSARGCLISLNSLVAYLHC